MNGQLHDLWPEDMLTLQVLTPISILKFQAVRLTEKSRGMIEGRIRTSILANQLSHSFLLVAPFLDGYECELLQIRHFLDLVYPVRIYWRGAPSIQSIAGDMVILTEDERCEIANSQFELEQILAKVLGAKDTLAIVQSMLAQSNEKLSEIETAAAAS
jgi:hypothetical protein